MKNKIAGSSVFFYTLYFSIPFLSILLSRFNQENFAFLTIVALVSLQVLCGFFLYRFYRFRLSNPYALAVLFILAALPFLFSGYLFSDDVERYAWEGYIQTQGFNPFLHSPDSPVFNSETLNQKVSHPQMTAIYPPFTQMVFAFLAFLSPAVFTFKIFFFILAVLFVYFLAKHEKLFGHAPFLAAMFPFFFIETIWSAHFDVMGIFLLALAVHYADIVRPVRSGLALGLAFMTKFLPAVFFPLFALYFYRHKSFKETLVFALFFALPLLLYIPYLSAGWSLFSSLKSYSSYWVFAGYFHSVLGMFLRPENSRLILLALFAVVWAMILWKKRGLSENIFLSLFFLMLFSPVTHPWYLLWLIPFARKKYFYTTLSILYASFLMYATLSDWFAFQKWYQDPLLTIFSYSFVLIVFLFETYVRYRLYPGSAK